MTDSELLVLPPKLHLTLPDVTTRLEMEPSVFASAEHSQTVSSAVAQEGRWQVQEETEERIRAKLGNLAPNQSHLHGPLSDCLFC